MEQGFVVAPIDFPLLDGLLADALAANGQTRHVVRRVDGKEENKGQDVDAQQDQYTIQQSTNNIGGHACPLSGSRAFLRSRRRAVCHTTSRPTPAPIATSHQGHHTGAFHARMESARSWVSSR